MPVKRVKIKKSEIKRDKFVDQLSLIVEDAKVNWRKYFIILSVVVLVILGAVFMINSNKKRSIEGLAQLSEATDVLLSGNYTEAIELLNSIKSNYFGTVAAKKAVYFIGLAQLNTNKFDEAIVSFRQFLKSKTGIEDLRAAALVGVGRAYEGKQVVDSSIIAYEEVVAKYPQTVYAPEAYISLGRMYETKYEVNKAVDSYEKVMFLYPESDYAKQAEFYKNMLEGAIDPLTQMQQGKVKSGEVK
ncbi:MAG: tetratricopeptide repeat protein [bacterium]|nr:tetratricopeptide repeat protein [bacterium]